MAIAYDRLWAVLKEKGMKKKDLEEAAQISHYTVNKFKHGDNLTTDILEKVCVALNCTMDDIMEIIPDNIVNTTDDGGNINHGNE